MKKKILLALTLFALVTGVSAQSLQNFEYSPEDDYSVDLTGGESFTQNVNFTSEADRELPFGVRVTVENDTTNFETGETIVGTEFDVTGTLTDSRIERRLSFTQRLTDGNLVYIGSINTENNSLGAFSENSLNLEIEANPAISPDNFNFEFDVRSAPGFAVETNSARVDSSTGQAEVNVGSSSVSVNTETGTDVTVESYNETTVSAPNENSNFVGGVGVEVRDSNNQDAEANGTVSIGYSQQVVDDRNLNENSMEVYFYNESISQWTTEGVEVVNRDTEDNVVEANVTHFSTYAAFAEEEQTSTSSSSDDDSSAGPIPFTPEEEDQDQTETQNDSEETQETTDQENETVNQTDNETQADQTDNQTETGTGESEGPSEQAQQNAAPQSPVGQFLESESNVFGGLIVLLVALVALLQYTGRVELRELREYVEQKVSR